MTTEKRIKHLSTLVANQIAAGEVVERPASVVKELLENSLDSGATKVELTIKNAGAQLIKVVDNGHGIHAEDLPLAVSRHATSKITSSEDLQKINSLGFRGEALASICSIAKVTLISKTANAKQAQQLICAGDQIIANKPSAHPEGTSIEISELFFNTPVRRRFLRTEKTEYQHIETVFKQMALSHFEVAFSLYQNTKLIYQLAPADTEKKREQRIAKLLGKRFMDHASFIDLQAVGLRLWGWLVSEEYARSSTDLQYFYVNQRSIKDKLLNHATRQAYRDNLPTGRQPSYLLNLELDAAEMDINVHPTKHEIRFHQPRLVYDFIFRGIYNLLHDKPQQLDYQANTLSTDHIKQPSASYHQAAENTASHNGNYLGRVQQDFALLEKPEGLLFIDIAALQAFHYQQQWQQPTPDSQALLFPVSVNTDNATLKAISEQFKLWHQLGFELAEFGEQSLLLRKIPVHLQGVDSEALLQKITDLYQKTDAYNKQQLITAISLFAGKQKAQVLDDEAIEQLCYLVMQQNADISHVSWLISADDIRAKLLEKYN